MDKKWKTRALGEVSNNFDSIRVPVKESDRRLGHYPYYGASGIVDRIDAYLFDGEYLLVAEDGENLRTKQTPVAFLARGQFWVNNHAHIIQGNTHADTRFLMYALQQTDISGYLTGSTMPKLTQGNMNRIPVPVPPLPEQKVIADILGSLDDKIELNRKTNETLEAMARAIFKSWFIDFDPVHAKSKGRQPDGMDAETAKLFPSSFQDTEIGKVPKGWKVGTLRDCCERVENGGTPSRSVQEYWEPKEIPWLTSGEVRQKIVTSIENSISRSGLKNSSAKLWKEKTTVVALYGATAGQVCFLGIETSANQACCGLIPKPAWHHYVYFHTSSSIATLEQQARGSAQQNLSQQIVADLPTLLPDDDTIAGFDALITILMDRCISNAIESWSLATVRDVLLPQLLSGKITVPVSKVA